MNNFLLHKLLYYLNDQYLEKNRFHINENLQSLLYLYDKKPIQHHLRDAHQYLNIKHVDIT